MSVYIRRELFHTLIAIGVTVLVAVGADLAKIQSFEDVSLAGLAVTAARTLGTATVIVGSRYVLKRE